MLRFTLAQMRVSVGRLIAGGLAIVIGTAFLTATILASALIAETERNAAKAGYAQADLVIPNGVTPAAVERIRRFPGVEAVSGRRTVYPQVEGPVGTAVVAVAPIADDPRLESQTIVSGSWPGPGELTLPEDAAFRLGLGVGDDVTVSYTLGVDPDSGEPTLRDTSTRLSGLTRDPAGAFAASGGEGVMPSDDWEALTRGGVQEAEGWWADPVLVLVRDDAAVVDVQAGLQRELWPEQPWAKDVLTLDEQADRDVAQLTGSIHGLTVFVLAFAAVALVVAGLVIANTFQVLVAQRTRHLALLRCVGAVRRQVRGSVVTEALFVGFTASAAGVLLGGALAQGTLLVLRQFRVGVPLPNAVDLRWPVVVVPLLVGTVVTLAAALVPARAATRVPALAALRPLDVASLRAWGGRLRLAAAAVLTTAGAGLVVLGLFESTDGVSSPELGLGLAVLGGAVSFLGVLVGAPFWAPPLTAVIGRVAGRVGGAPAVLAAANSARNPRRTAATVTALLIGVTLVTTVSTAAASARSILDHELDSRYPVDVVIGETPVWSNDGLVQGAEVAASRLDALRAVDGVEGVVSVGTAVLDLRIGRPDWHAEPFRVPDEQALALLHDGSAREAISGGAVALDPAGFGLPDDGLPDTVELRAPGTEAWMRVPVFWARYTGLDPTVSSDVAGQLGVDVAPTQAWAGLEDGAGDDVVSAMRDSLIATATDGAPPLALEGPVVRRADYARVIDTLLLIVLGLLAIAVLIAVLGVSNTLALSVIERRRESATLRAIGLTRGQLRRSLAVEGMVIAGVGAVAGIVLGLLYGWAGAVTVFAGVIRGRAPGAGLLPVEFLALPLGRLGLVLLGALAAGLLASVLPARGAVRSSPVAALATD